MQTEINVSIYVLTEAEANNFSTQNSENQAVFCKRTIGKDSFNRHKNEIKTTIVHEINSTNKIWYANFHSSVQSGQSIN